MGNIRENPKEHFRGLVPERDRLLRNLEEEAEKENIPIVGPLVGYLLYVLARFSKARAILELGTANGYSGIFLGRAARENQGRLISLEKDGEMAARARQNLKNAGLNQVVEVREGDALELIPSIQGPMDLVFLDIEKEDYVKTLDDCARILRPGGLLAADNTAFIHADAFNKALAARKDFCAIQLFSFLPDHSPEQDGLCLALKM